MKKLLKKQKNIEIYEKIMLKFLSKTVEFSSEQKKNAFSQIQKELSSHPFPENVLGYVDFNEWIDKKV